MKASEAKALRCTFLFLVRGMVLGYSSSDSWGAFLYVSNIS